MVKGQVSVFNPDLVYPVGLIAASRVLDSLVASQNEKKKKNCECHWRSKTHFLELEIFAIIQINFLKIAVFGFIL